MKFLFSAWSSVLSLVLSDVEGRDDGVVAGLNIKGLGVLPLPFKVVVVVVVVEAVVVRVSGRALKVDDPESDPLANFFFKQVRSKKKKRSVLKVHYRVCIHFGSVSDLSQAYQSR